MTYGLPARPSLSDEDLAALVSAAQEVLRVRALAQPMERTPAWRFSGRWFNHGPFDQRRPRRGL